MQNRPLSSAVLPAAETENQLSGLNCIVFSVLLAKVIMQGGLKLVLKLNWTDDVNVWYPVPHDGQHLILMPDFGRDNEAATANSFSMTWLAISLRCLK